jgi:hypothetical protein
VASVQDLSVLHVSSQLTCVSTAISHWPPVTSKAKFALAVAPAVRIASIRAEATSHAPLLPPFEIASSLSS